MIYVTYMIQIKNFLKTGNTQLFINYMLVLDVNVNEMNAFNG